jgi:hypothetical protein
VYVLTSNPDLAGLLSKLPNPAYTFVEKLLRNAGRNIEVSVEFFGGSHRIVGKVARKKEESREDFKIRDQKMIEKI